MEHTYLELPGQSVYAKGGKIGYLDEESLSVIPVSESRTVNVTDVRTELSNNSWMSPDHDIWDPRTQYLYRRRIYSSSSLQLENLVPDFKLTSSFVRVGSRLQSPDLSGGDMDELEEYLKSLSDFTKLHNEYIMIKEDNIGEFNRQISTRDILGNTSEVCLICPRDGSYTSTININSQIPDCNPTQLRVGIFYSKGTKMFSKDVVIPTTSQYVNSGTDDFVLEYSDGCLRVFPDSQEVSECVISYCYLTYEYLI